MPRVSDDDADGLSGVHVPGVWFGVIGEMRNRESTSVHRYLASPIEVLTLAAAAYSALAERARGDAERWYEERLASKEPVVVVRALLRAPTLRVPKDVLLQDRSTKTFRVASDDTVVPWSEPPDAGSHHLPPIPQPGPSAVRALFGAEGVE